MIWQLSTYLGYGCFGTRELELLVWCLACIHWDRSTYELAFRSTSTSLTEVNDTILVLETNEVVEVHHGPWVRVVQGAVTGIRF